MEGTRSRRTEQSRQEARSRRTAQMWRWVRWVALALAVSWAVNWASSLIRGEQGWDLWWPLTSTVMWAGAATHCFVTYHRLRTAPPTPSDRPLNERGG